MSENAQVTKRAGLIGLLTLMSRISGLLRDAVLAFFFGAGSVADAFYMAFTIPNLLRRFVAEGALTISFIPIFTGEMKKSHDSARILSHQAFSYLFLLLIVLVTAGIYLSPAIVKVMAAGFQEDPEKFSLTVRLTKLCFPYILFVSLAALVMGILNSFKKFGAPAAAPIFLNVGLITGAVISPNFNPPVLGLVAGVLAGGAMQLAVQLPDLIRLGFFPKINFRIHPELKSLLGLMLPAAYGAAVYQLNVIILRLFASYLPTGAVSYLWYANRIFEFPMGVFAIALASAIQPTLSDFAADENWDKFRDSINFGIRLNLFITIPAMVGLVVLAHPIVRILLQRGEFQASTAEATATALMAFALGLPFLGLVRLIVPAFYALKDAKRPVWFASLAVGVNLLFAYLMVGPLQHNGLALALSLSSLVNALGLLWWLKLRLGTLGENSIFRVVIQAIIASTAMGFVLWLPQFRGLILKTNSSLLLQGAELLLSIFGGILVYFGVTAIIGCKESKQTLQLLARKLKK